MLSVYLMPHLAKLQTMQVERGSSILTASPPPDATPETDHDIRDTISYLEVGMLLHVFLMVCFCIAGHVAWPWTRVEAVLIRLVEDVVD